MRYWFPAHEVQDTGLGLLLPSQFTSDVVSSRFAFSATNATSALEPNNGAASSNRTRTLGICFFQQPHEPGKAAPGIFSSRKVHLAPSLLVFRRHIKMELFRQALTIMQLCKVKATFPVCCKFPFAAFLGIVLLILLLRCTFY